MTHSNSLARLWKKSSSGAEHACVGVYRYTGKVRFCHRLLSVLYRSEAPTRQFACCTLYWFDLGLKRPPKNNTSTYQIKPILAPNCNIENNWFCCMKMATLWQGSGGKVQVELNVHVSAVYRYTGWVRFDVDCYRFCIGLSLAPARSHMSDVASQSVSVLLIKSRGPVARRFIFEANDTKIHAMAMLRSAVKKISLPD